MVPKSKVGLKLLSNIVMGPSVNGHCEWTFSMVESRMIDLVATSHLLLAKKGRKNLSLPYCHLNLPYMGAVLLKGEGWRFCHDIFRIHVWQHLMGPDGARDVLLHWGLYHSWSICIRSFPALGKLCWSYAAAGGEPSIQNKVPVFPG